jgi:hypothetical protein
MPAILELAGSLTEEEADAMLSDRARIQADQ